ncbi:helix-turn-helix transcriptional regulator [Allorhizocola rhizosphaerae]|uniref:helix-turn-helix transcriptional regulator n=1 Tax=Allorhizocola rhizosphaerae TaxID=1872709 RepID=UPI0013C2B84F|nr:helix-turn-helix transcriptional regulator [Allorhizocola rhizosphaerae]
MPPRRRRDPGRVAREVQENLVPAGNAIDVINRAIDVLLPHVPAAIWCGVVVDPATLLDTGGEHRSGFPASVMPRLFEIEHGEQDDVDSLRRLVRRAEPASALSASTAGQLHTSKYYRDILRPLDLADELRVLLRDGGRTWGLLVMCREEGTAGYSAQDVEIAAAVAVPAAAALRKSLLTGGVDGGTVPDAPGVAVVNRDHSMAALSPTAQHWLDRLAENHEPGRTPHAVSAIVSHARAGEPGAIARSRARTRDGGWVTLHAWHTSETGQTTISIGPALPGELAALILDAYPFTAREREITQLVLLGRSTAEIAAALYVSTHTVQDHLKAVFDKTGVRSRRDLVADVFFQHYLPQLASARLTTDGRLLTQ